MGLNPPRVRIPALPPASGARKTFAPTKSNAREQGRFERSSADPSELRILRALKTPAGVQRYLDDMPYHLAGTAGHPGWYCATKPPTASRVRPSQRPPCARSVFRLSSSTWKRIKDTDHVIAIFQSRGHWGAIAKSNFTGCRYREPVYRTLRELALSYFHIYFNLRGERTLRRYSRPVNLSRFDRLHWMTTEKNIWFVAEYLCEIPHRPLLKRGLEKNLTRIDARTMKAEMVGHRTKTNGA